MEQVDIQRQKKIKPHHKPNSNSKWITDNLYVNLLKCKTKRLGKTAQEHIFRIEDSALNSQTWHQSMIQKMKIHRLYLKQIKTIYSVKTHVMWMKRQATDLEKIFANYTSAKGVVFRIYKEFSKPNSKKIKLENGKKISKDISLKRTYRQ